MEHVAWDPSFSVHVDRLDQDHRELFAMVDKLFTAIAKGQGRTIVDQLIKVLFDYTRYHFSAEEALMAKAKYPGLSAHRVEHRNLLSRISEIRCELAEDPTSEPIQLADLMQKWLAKHIRKSDQEYSSLMNTVGIN
jgi:hemerythrin-like metal-binding protein